MAFTFDDIGRLTDREIQLVLQKVDREDLAAALKGARPGMKDRIFSNVSPRIGQMIKEAMKFSEPVYKSHVEDGQIRIVQTVRRLVEMGEVTIDGMEVGEGLDPESAGSRDYRVRRIGPEESSPRIRPLIGPLAAMLGPMGPRLRGILYSCLPDPVVRGVNAKLASEFAFEEEEATPLEVDLRFQAETAWQVPTEASDPDGGSEPYDLGLVDVLALMLRGGKPSAIAKALEQMPGSLPADVLFRIAASDFREIPARIRRKEARIFLRKLGGALVGVSLEPSPLMAAQAIREVPPVPARRIMTDLNRVRPDVMKKVQGLAYAVHDLLDLSDPELQMVLTGIQDREIGLILKSASAIIRTRFIQNMSPRRRKAVDAEATWAGKVNPVAAQNAKEQLLDRARSLYEKGRLNGYFGSIEDIETKEEKWMEVRKAVYGRYSDWVAKGGWRYRERSRQSVGVVGIAICFVLIMLLLFKLLNVMEEFQKKAGSTVRKGLTLEQI